MSTWVALPIISTEVRRLYASSMRNRDPCSYKDQPVKQAQLLVLNVTGYVLGRRNLMPFSGKLQLVE